MTRPDAEQIQAALASYPEYEKGSAYVRAKLCCEVLTKLGHPIPSWILIRGHIGKGSAGDISRGVKDYRMEHASLLQRMDGLPEGIPDQLAQPMQALWQAALNTANALFEKQRDAFEAEMRQSEQAVEQALQESARVAADLALLNERLLGVQNSLAQEHERANTERAGREQAERMAEKHIANITQQRDDMTQVVEANTAEMKVLTNRLENERRHALMQIEQARQQVEFARQQAHREGEQKMASMEALLRREMSEQSLEHYYLQKRYSDLNVQVVKLRELLNQKNRSSSLKRKSVQSPAGFIQRKIKKTL